MRRPHAGAGPLSRTAVHGACGPRPDRASGHLLLAAPGELYPIVAPLAWEGRRLPKRDRIARLPFLPDPVAPDKPLLILVDTFSKNDVFGPDLGEVVAQGVDTGLTAEADDVTHRMSWRVVAASAQEAWLMARYRAENHNCDTSLDRAVRLSEAPC